MPASDPTDIPPPQESSLVHSAELHPAKAKAHERSPTLLAGESAGSQGQVRIWQPSRIRLWMTTFGLGLGLLLIGACTSRHPVSDLLPFALLLASLSAVVDALRHPRYITTDDAGIGISIAGGNRALRWEDIRAARRVCFWRLHAGITLLAPQRLYINLTGYPADLRDELFNLIVSHAELHPHPLKTQKDSFGRWALPQSQNPP